ncbi:unnamed protein product, partial [Brenthis ino]
MEDVWVELRAPRFVVHGHSAVLRCEHNVDAQTLYKVVFFKSGQRIMQYVQGRDPPYELYNFTGADINVVFFKSGQRIMQYVQGRDPPYELYNFTGADINIDLNISQLINLRKLVKSV